MEKNTVTAKRHKPKLHIRKGDMVIVLSGNDKGKKARVIKVYVDEMKALVEGVNIIHRHSKPDAKNTQGGIVKKEAPVHISKLSLIDPKSGTATRISRSNENGKSVRISKKSNQQIK